jgi:archaemetzincin
VSGSVQPWRCPLPRCPLRSANALWSGVTLSLFGRLTGAAHLSRRVYDGGRKAHPSSSTLSAHEMSKPCLHARLQLEPSAFAAEAGFERCDAKKRLDAARKTVLKTPTLSYKEELEEEARQMSATFPGPLVLPWDDLNHDPDYPPHSFKDWLTAKTRNKPSKQRQTLYVAAVPDIDDSVAFMKEWTIPNLQSTERPAKRLKVEQAAEALASPETKHFVEYLTAFYHGLKSKQLSQKLSFVKWEGKGSGTARSLPKYVGLAYGDSATRIRVRPSKDGVFAAQLNLNDLLDAALEILPKDAYSIVLLVDHDIYEDEEDDYCCGRAYGGSRIAVVQSARYNPALDAENKIDRAHMWPASHCQTYVDALCAEEDVKPQHEGDPIVEDGAVRAAIDAAKETETPSTTEDLRGLWFSRLARTVAHELGHCLGMDHCVYYACSMQGTAGMAEDTRQPPYLCPVCSSKMSHAMTHELRCAGVTTEHEYKRQRYEALASFCEKWTDVGMFAGYAAWLKVRLIQLELDN